jgi:hypothetical protein
MQRNISINHVYGEAYYRSENMEIIIRDPKKPSFAFGSFGVFIITWIFMNTKELKVELHLTLRTSHELHALLATNPLDIVYFLSTCEHKNITMYKNGELQITGGLFEKVFKSNEKLKHKIEEQWNDVRTVSSRMIHDMSL